MLYLSFLHFHKMLTPYATRRKLYNRALISLSKDQKYSKKIDKVVIDKQSKTHDYRIMRELDTLITWSMTHYNKE